MPAGATHRHRLAHLPHAASRHRTIRVSAAPFRLAELSLPPSAMTIVADCVLSAWRLACTARRHTSSTLLLVPWHLNRSPRDLNHTT